MTIHSLSLGEVQINPDAKFVFPQSRCCNCGTTSNISTENQNTKVTRYFMFAGTEITFDFSLPVCPDCSISLRRRVPTLFHKFLVVAAVTAAVFLLFVTVLAQVTSKVPFIAYNTFPSSLVISTILVFVFYALRRPRGNQTSVYQPVRISKLDQEFVSGDIKTIGFAFTNAMYLHDFVQANSQAVRAGLVCAIKAS